MTVSIGQYECEHTWHGWVGDQDIGPVVGDWTEDNVLTEKADMTLQWAGSMIAACCSKLAFQQSLPSPQYGEPLILYTRASMA